MELGRQSSRSTAKLAARTKQASREAKQAIKSALGERMGSMSTGEHCRRAGKSRTASKKKKTAKNSRVRAKFGGRLGEGSVCKTGDFEVRLVPKALAAHGRLAALDRRTPSKPPDAPKESRAHENKGQDATAGAAAAAATSVTYILTDIVACI